MANLFDIPDTAEDFLRNFAEDLEGTFHVIAHAGITGRKFIKERQRYFKKRYVSKIDRLDEYGIKCLPANFHIHLMPAYNILESLLSAHQTPEQIKQECDEAIYEHLNFPEEYLFEPFKELN